MRLLAGAAILTAVLGFTAQPTLAQSRLDHDVQKMWDDTFHPEQRGTPRTDWERRRDAERYGYERDRHREAERAEWCRYHPGACGAPAYGAPAYRAPGYGAPAYGAPAYGDRYERY